MFLNRQMKTGILVLILISVLFSSQLIAQQKTIQYSIINKGDTIGNTQFVQRINGDDMFITVTSLIVTKMLVNIKVNVEEQAHFIDGKLVLSTVKRYLNDKPKANKETKASGDFYLLSDDKKQSRLNQKQINYNVSMLFFKEPVGISHVYSDFYQKFVTIQSKEKHIYKVDLPEGGSNVYYYTSGICSKVDLHNSLFNAQMLLNN